ncbi:nitrilase [Vibrio breoganii]|uniref:carbon-nitrogen hydrolase family protein n=1 Tax=Vibrio breoganii TaxID=553239 RepID=UPI000C85AD92|nr:carbon-nitrogen hydrolase family protein [Vibrio breoganii]PMG88861.1 nitrilase [Vibrio breoganii]PMK16492.1 nitrilase [Vibrio breoganii]PML40074.1 nitrilase [Vibrio breoganii]PML61590.1 nitrilase [Vibrio breoganii]PML89137.1 nitrilase [Vibrio breoganii]
MKVKVAISQKPPVLLELENSIEVALNIIEEAAEKGTQLLVFPETFLPGYPTWIWRLKPGGDMALGNEIHSRLRSNAVDLHNGGLNKICGAAKAHNMVIVIGFTELDSEHSGSTLYNSVAVIDADGTIVNRHRKLMPTNPERMVWGMGDASGLHVVETAVGRVGTLICWENYMPMARYALYAQNIDIYVAPTWDSGETWLASMNHIAREGGCWVLATATALHGRDIPENFPSGSELFSKEEWINPGDAVVVKPFGGVVAGPLHEEQELLYAEIETEESAKSRKTLDVSGHYNRPDIFHFEVDRRSMAPVIFWDDGDFE